MCDMLHCHVWKKETRSYLVRRQDEAEEIEQHLWMVMLIASCIGVIKQNVQWSCVLVLHIVWAITDRNDMDEYSGLSKFVHAQKKMKCVDNSCRNARNKLKLRCILLKFVSCALHFAEICLVFYSSWAPCEQIYVATYVHELIWRPSVA